MTTLGRCWGSLSVPSWWYRWFCIRASGSAVRTATVETTSSGVRWRWSTRIWTGIGTWCTAHANDVCEGGWVKVWANEKKTEIFKLKKKDCASIVRNECVPGAAIGRITAVATTVTAWSLVAATRRLWAHPRVIPFVTTTDRFGTLHDNFTSWTNASLFADDFVFILWHTMRRQFAITSRTAIWVFVEWWRNSSTTDSDRTRWVFYWGRAVGAVVVWTFRYSRIRWGCLKTTNIVNN